MNHVPVGTAGTHRRRWLSSVAVAAALLVGFAVGVMIPESTAELDAASQEIEELTAQTESLTADLAGVEADNAALTDSVEDAEAEVRAAEAALEAAEGRSDARATRLDQREEALDQRELDLESRESVVADSSADDSTDGLATSSTAFDRDYAVTVTGDILVDIRTIDHRLKDGIAVSSALSLLTDNFGRLLDAGTPPGVNAADYHGRLTTLESFAGQASDMYDADPTEGSAKYAVVREQTGVLLSALNSALGTSFSLP